MPFENIVGKGENADDQHFFAFPTMFFSLPNINFKCSLPLILSSANSFNLDQYKILSFGKESNATTKQDSMLTLYQAITCLNDPKERVF